MVRLLVGLVVAILIGLLVVVSTVDTSFDEACALDGCAGNAHAFNGRSVP